MPPLPPDPPNNFLDSLRLQVLLEELEKRTTAPTFDIVSAAALPWQQDFIRDANLHKALFGERRGGKTTCMGIAAVDVAMRKPHSKCLYVGHTQDSCTRNMYDGVLAQLLRQYKLPAKLVGGDTMKFDNGSIIYLVGLDANKKQKERVRGLKSNLNIVDEMQGFTQDTSLILNDVIGPSTADTKAPTIIGGTAGNALGKNYWYEITKDNSKAQPVGPSVLHPEWEVYRCEWEKNTAIDEETGNRICDNVREYLAEKRAKHPGIELTPGYRQEWNAEWIIETSALIYRFSECNLLTSPTCIELDTGLHIPTPSVAFAMSATFILGIDLGYNDPTALTVVAYNLKYSNKLYVIHTFQQSQMLVPHVAAKIQELDRIYHFTYKVGDSSSLQVFETLKDYPGIGFIEKADRAGKLSHQYELNSDLQLRQVVFMPGNEELVQQLQTLIWDKDSFDNGSYVEDPRYKNDLADSFLYAHNFSRHFWYEAPKVVPTEEDRFHQAILQGEIQHQTQLGNKLRPTSPYHQTTRTYR